jgi:chemotaxis protein MotB
MPGLSARRRRGDRSVNFWPAWVDVLSNLLMVVTFVLLVFGVTQFYLTSTVSGQDQAMGRLKRQIADLGATLALERKSGGDLKAALSRLSAELQATTAARDQLAAGLANTTADRDALKDRLTQLSARADAEADQGRRTAKDLEEAYKTIGADRQTLDLKLREIASLQADLDSLRQARAKLEGDVAALAAARDTSDSTAAGLTQTLARNAEALDLSRQARDQLLAELGVARDRSKALEADLAGAREKTMLAQKDIDQRDIRLQALAQTLDQSRADLAAKTKQAEDNAAQAALLSQQLGALRDQLARLNTALDAAEARDKDQQVQIADLGTRLNTALASKVEELARYRSEFFGRLREALGERPDIKIVGDRFVFQSEVLFPSGSADLQDSGKAQLASLAPTLIDITRTIPPDINWILRVDGHTDRRAINHGPFATNWELSAARAIAVVKFLADQGLPPDRLAAAAFGEYQPVDPNDSDAAYARNRRIEIKFDQR